jgi:hypothetical protein
MSKLTRAKWTGGVVQAAKRLLCKLEALSSNPNPTKRKNLINVISVARMQLCNFRVKTGDRVSGIHA